MINLNYTSFNSNRYNSELTENEVKRIKNGVSIPIGTIQSSSANMLTDLLPSFNSNRYNSEIYDSNSKNDILGVSIPIGTIQSYPIYG